MKNNSFKFIKLGNNYLCVQQNFLKWIIYRCIHKDLFLTAQVSIRKLIKLLLCKFNIISIKKTLNLPFYGQLCIPVYGGYKIFDVFEKKVSKKLSDEIKTSQINKEFSQLQLSGKLKCSPAIIRMNAEQRWYQEEYLRSILQLQDLFEQKQSAELFKIHILPLLKSIIFHESPVEINLSDYIDKESSKIKYDRLKNYDAKGVAKIKQYVLNIVNFLDSKNDFKIYTAVSHGDFNFKNIIVTTAGTKLIDWELIMNRSILHDFFNFYFSFLRNNLIQKDLGNEIQNSFQLIYKNCNLNSYNPCLNLNDFFKTYRYLYYFERICSLFKFRALIHPKNKIRNLFRNIDAFQRFEKKCSVTLS